MKAELTVAEACTILHPPMTQRQLHAIIAALHIPPDGHRDTGRSGRKPNTYNAATLMKLHAALAPWLTVTYDNSQATALSGDGRTRMPGAGTCRSTT